MNKIKSVKGVAAPLSIKDVDTDMLIPAQFLTSTSRDGYGENLFRRLRDQDPNFVLNLPRYSKAKILVGDSNFGCGSSREHAVWALQGWGFGAVIAKSFADIFFSNSSKSGLILVVLPESEVERIRDLAEREQVEIEVNLEKLMVIVTSSLGVESIPFSYDPFRRHCILEGLDDISYIMSAKSEIDSYRAAQEKVRFYSAKSPNRN